jgi:hypothetical protein
MMSAQRRAEVHARFVAVVTRGLAKAAAERPGVKPGRKRTKQEAAARLFRPLPTKYV